MWLLTLRCQIVSIFMRGLTHNVDINRVRTSCMFSMGMSCLTRWIMDCIKGCVYKGGSFTVCGCVWERFGLGGCTVKSYPFKPLHSVTLTTKQLFSSLQLQATDVSKTQWSFPKTHWLTHFVFFKYEHSSYTIRLSVSLRAFIYLCFLRHYSWSNRFRWCNCVY